MSVPGARNGRTCVEVGAGEFGPSVADEVCPDQGFARRPAKDLRRVERVSHINASQLSDDNSVNYTKW
jgi:hypothetical protein